MTRKTKIAIIILASLLLAGGIGIGIYYLINKDDSSEGESTDGDLNEFIEPLRTGGTNPTGGTTIQTPTNPNQVVPRYDSEGQISNAWGEVKNRMLYPKREWAGGYGYANIRTSPEVNNEQGFWTDGYSDNLITTISSGTPIGTAEEVETKTHNNFPYRWYKVKLYKSVDGWFSDYTEGYVRSDTVTFKPYDR